MRRGKVIAIIAVLSLLGFSMVTAQQETIGERELRKFPDDPALSNLRCGQYFMFGPTRDYVDPTLRIGFLLEKKPSDSPNISLVGAFRPENIKVVIDNQKKIPTVRIFSAENVVIRISQEEYNKSPCLQKARKAREDT